MKYFESDSDYSSVELNSPVDIVRYVVTSIFLSPIRLIIEVSKKVMFTGEYFKKFILNCLYLNLIAVVVSLASSLLITKRFYLYGSLLPISSLALSLVGLIAIYYFGNKYAFDVNLNELENDLDSQMDNLRDVYGEEDNNVDVIKDKNVSENINIDLEEEIEINTDEDFDKVYNEEFEKQSVKIPEDFKDDIARRIEEERKKLRSTTNLHPSETNIKQDFINIKEQEDRNADYIKGLCSDESSDFADRIGNIAESIRGYNPSNNSFDVVESDDSPLVTSKGDLSSYNKDIMSKVNKKAKSLDDMVLNSNTSTLVDLEDEYLNIGEEKSAVDIFTGYIMGDSQSEDNYDSVDFDEIYINGGFEGSGYKDLGI